MVFAQLASVNNSRHHVQLHREDHGRRAPEVLLRHLE